MEIQKYEAITLAGHTKRYIVGVLIYTMAVQPVLAAATLPTSGSVAAGQVTIGRSGNTMTVSQGSDKAIVNWRSFSVGKEGTVNFVQPDRSSAILNRVTSSTTSTIAGAIHANGQVFLINPNGIAITPTGTIKVGGGFVGSTLNLSDQDFLDGHFNFKGNGASAGVNNAGIITVGRGGYAALIGGRVKNSGLIAAPLGKIGLGSGEQATLNLSGDGFLQVALPTKVGAEGTDSKGALIENQGTLSADGGTVLISVASAREAARHVINLSGVVEANSVSGHDGKIIIGGGQGGEVIVSGKVIATSASGKGGDITVTGNKIALQGAILDTSGATGGGSIKIGGDYQGKGSTQRAHTTHVDKTSVIHADATQSGHGGKVIVWSDDLTRFDGLITARGAGTGKGGEVEVSGKAILSYNGFTNLTGPGGFGTLLLDPYNVTISNDSGKTSSGFTATGDDSVINVTTLQNALSSSNVTVSTGGAGSKGSQAGNITVANAVTWSSGSTLELSAYHNINVNGNLSGGKTDDTKAQIVLRADNSVTGSGTVTFGSGTKTTAVGGVSIYYNPISYTSATDYSGNMGTDTTATAYMLVNSVANLQDINTNPSGTYVLGKDIDASATETSNDGAGFVPLGDKSTKFTGTFDGQGHVISNLNINRPDRLFVGLFGYVGAGGRIRNVGLEGGSISGHSYVGGLVGENDGTISHVYATGSVSAGSYAGGLVGLNKGGTISHVYATGSVGGPSYINYVGGLVGINLGGTIGNTYATGPVTVTFNDHVGGLVGYNSMGGSVTASFWDTDTTHQPHHGVVFGPQSGTVSVKGLTTEQARDKTQYIGWDFHKTWYQAGDMRPILRSEAATAVGGVISVSNLHQPGTDRCQSFCPLSPDSQY